MEILFLAFINIFFNIIYLFIFLFDKYKTLSLYYTTININNITVVGQSNIISLRTITKATIYNLLLFV